MAFNYKGFQPYLCCGRVTRFRMMTGRGAGKLGGSGPFLHIHRRQGELFGRKRNVNIFEEGSAGYAANTIGGFEEVVSGLSAMFTTEGIGKNERLGKLTRTHEKASAIKIPITFCMHDFHRSGSYWLRTLNFSLAKCCECTRRTMERQLHMNCAGGGIPGPNFE
jgi:hypothetical protein